MNLKKHKPKFAEEAIGKEFEFEGCLFSASKKLESAKYMVLKWRWSEMYFMDLKTFKPTRPGIEFLLKRKGMKRSQWTRPFKCPGVVADQKGNWVKESSK